MADAKISATVKAPQNTDRRTFLKQASIGSAVAAGSLAFGGLLKANLASAETRPRGGPGLRRPIVKF